MAYLEVRLAGYSAFPKPKTQKEVREAWNGNADFQILDFGPDYGRYINKEDADKTPGLHVLVRYADDRKVVGVK